MATLLGIAIKPQRGADMQVVQAAELSVEAGVSGDSRGRPGPRQVTLLSKAAWDTACRELGVDLPWLTRRANLLVDDLPLLQTTGGHIRIGGTLLEVTGETDPCSRMEAAQPGLFQALAGEWRGGVTCRVIRGGPLQPGMPVEMV